MFTCWIRRNTALFHAYSYQGITFDGANPIKNIIWTGNCHINMFLSVKVLFKTHRKFIVPNYYAFVQNVWLFLSCTLTNVCFSHCKRLTNSWLFSVLLVFSIIDQILGIRFIQPFNGIYTYNNHFTLQTILNSLVTDKKVVFI